eukprot:1591830-Pleurochrysis_carterae.AAC.1
MPSQIWHASFVHGKRSRTHLLVHLGHICSGPRARLALGPIMKLVKTHASGADLARGAHPGRRE